MSAIMRQQGWKNYATTARPQRPDYDFSKSRVYSIHKDSQSSLSFFSEQDMWLTTKLTNWKSSLYMLLKIFLETGSKLKSIPISQCESRKRGKSWIRRRYQH